MNLTKRELILLMAAAIVTSKTEVFRELEAIKDAEFLVSEYDRTHKQE